jgi:dUTP pyrophosphatase
MFNDLKKLMQIQKQLKNLDLNTMDPKTMNVEEMLNKLGVDDEVLKKHTDEIFRFRNQLKFSKIHPDAVSPKYNYETDSGFDLHSIEELEVPSLGRSIVKTGLKFEIPIGSELQIRPKSGLALKQGLTVLNTPGTVDQGYTGEVMVIVFNASDSTIKIKKGMKIAQGVLSPVFAGRMVNLHEVVEINEKDRGDNGFGSTGI